MTNRTAVMGPLPGPGSGSELLDLSANDATPTKGSCVALWVDVAGTVKFQCLDDSVDTYTVNAGACIPMQVKRVFKVGTSSTGIHAIY